MALPQLEVSLTSFKEAHLLESMIRIPGLVPQASLRLMELELFQSQPMW